MSQEDARSFLERLEGDAALRQAVANAIESHDAERLVAVSAQHGLSFTPSELEGAWKERERSAGKGELSKAELERVAGGLGEALPSGAENLHSIVSEVESNRRGKEQLRLAQRYLEAYKMAVE